MIFCISAGYSKKVLKTSQFSSQLLTQEGYCFHQASPNWRKFSSALSKGINFLQICNHFLNILITDILGGTADLMDDAALQAAFGIYRLDRVVDRVVAVSQKTRFRCRIQYHNIYRAKAKKKS